MLTTIDEKNIPLLTPKRGEKIDFSSGIDVQVLKPGGTYFTDDVNQNSVVLKITDGKVTFLLMDDAGLEAEKFSNKENIQDSEVLEAFKESRDRVISIALIHEELHEGGEYESLNFSLYLEKLAENLLNTYRVGHSHISLDLDLEDNVFFDMDIAVPLGMIINELVSNSLKYAFPGRDEGKIQIKLLSEWVTNEPNNKEELKRKDTKYTLIVTDNGIGIPDNINLENSDTLGLQLVSILVDQLDAKIKVRRDQGTEFTIWFNDIEK